MSTQLSETTLPQIQQNGQVCPDPALLRQAILFQPLDDQVLTRIGAVSAVLTLPEDTQICRQGDPADRLFVLISGQVALSNTAPNGTSAVVEVIPPGGHFTLATVLARLPLLMNAHTVTQSRLIAIDAAALLALLQTEVSLATALLRAEAMDFRSLVRQVCDLKLRTTAQRLGCYLLALSTDQTANTASLRLPFDKRLLAARLGCRQENLSRAFAALRSLGVETHGSRVILHDIARLRDYSAPDEFTEAEFA
jgi:CRP/FNR family transcriptional regulator, transcriptional activator FtrB